MEVKPMEVKEGSRIVGQSGAVLVVDRIEDNLLICGDRLVKLSAVKAVIPGPPQGIELRPYQVELLGKIYSQWVDRRSVLAQLPTGGGKSVLFGAVAKGATLQGSRVLVIAHREELITQGARHLAHWCDSSMGSIGIVKNGYPLHPERPIQVASVQSLTGRRSALGDFGLVVVDEAHHATSKTYLAALESCPNARILGLTATPHRLDGKGFDDIFDDLVTGISTAELIEQGYLSKFKYFADPSPMVTAGARTISGDFSASDIARANDSGQLSGNLIASYRRYASGLRCVVFAINCEHSQDIAAAYNQANIPAAHLDANSPKEYRRSTLEAFKRGEIKVLCNVGLLEEGVDIPALEAVQIARPTKSLTKYLQICGRVLRTAEGKENAIIIDHTENWVNLGLPDERRTWSLFGEPKSDRTPLERNEETGEVEEKPRVPVVTEPDIPLLDITAEREAASKLYWSKQLDELLTTAKLKGYKPGWIHYRLEELKPPLEVWQAAGRALGYKHGWAWNRYQETLLEATG
jgi:superfamily II DNA or RNA helicase